MTQPTLTVELGYLTGWTLGTSLLGTSTYLAEVTYSQDISADVRSVSIRRGRQHELNRVEAGTASVQVLNQDGAMTRIPPMTNIRIRADFDESPAIPFPSISGLTARYDYSDISTLFTDTARTTAITADGQVIKGVTDLSGIGNHLSEATNGPTYKTAIQNGQSVARFDGTNDRIGRTALIANIATPYTAFLVLRVISAASQDSYMDGDASGRGQTVIYDNLGSGKWGSYYGTSPISSTVSNDTLVHVFQATANGASSVLRIDGGADVLSGDPGTGTLDSIVFCTDLPAGGINFSNADYSEALIYTGALSLADINSVGAYLADHWGTTWSTAV